MEQKQTKEIDQPISPESAREILWRNGVLHWMLHPAQIDLYNNYRDCTGKIVVWNCSRRLGKSHTLCTIAIETCIKTPNSIVKYCCDKQINAKTIIRPLIRDIIATCPKDIRPQFKTQDRAWVFPNGSRIELSGLDGGRAESIRGGSAGLGIIDEAGLVDDLDYIIDSILLPTTTTTKGKIILASTPPKSSGHAFVKMMNKARYEGNLVTKTIYDNPLIDPSELQKIIDRYSTSGGVNSTTFRREYLAEVLIDTNYAVIPEFTKELKAKVIQNWKRPPFYDCYVSMDLGLRDLTVVLFAYYDFKEAKIVIEDEFVINGQKFTTNALAEGIRKKEIDCFTEKLSGETRIPYMRVSDNNLIVINDLRQLHGLGFIPTRKDDADAALNQMRMMIGDEKIIINPRCMVLIQHLEQAVWNKNKTSFERSDENGHYDAVDALKYLVRNVQTLKNPYPAFFGMKTQEDVFQINKPRPENRAYNQMLNIKK